MRKFASVFLLVLACAAILSQMSTHTDSKAAIAPPMTMHHTSPLTTSPGPASENDTPAYIQSVLASVAAWREGRPA